MLEYHIVSALVFIDLVQHTLKGEGMCCAIRSPSLDMSVGNQHHTTSSLAVAGDRLDIYPWNRF